MEQPVHNKYNYVFTVNDDSNVTPPEQHLQSMDVHILDQPLVNFMQQVLISPSMATILKLPMTSSWDPPTLSAPSTP
jgi:hypothetical protein